MSRRQRIVLLVLAAVVLVAGIAVAAGSGGDDEPERSGATTPPAAETQPAEEGGATTQRKKPPAPRVETIRIRGGRPAGGERTLRYERGDTIRLRFTTDARRVVHIHGFDNEFPVSPGGARAVNFKASLEGIFEIEEHDTGELLAKLEIRPE